MNIVDKAHAGQVVTSKGRAYKFDAIECMINYLKDNAQVDYAHMLVADFSQPGELIPASDAKYLISKDIPSPMGMFLSAFPNEASLNNTLKKVNGKSYTWDQIQDEVH
jgi:copper chaperone NosL